MKAIEDEESQEQYVYTFEYDDMGDRTLYKKTRNGVVQESAEYTYNLANQLTADRLYDGKHYKNVEYTYDTDGNRIFQLNYNLLTDDDWKGNSGNGNSGNNSGNGTGSESGNNGSSGNNGNANGNTNNTGGSQNQSGILFPIEGEVSELEQEMIDMIKTTGKHKNYELIEYVNDVNREHAEVLMELTVNGIMDTAYSYGNERLTNERFTGWTGYHTYDLRGSVSGVTDSEGMIWQPYRYDVFGNITFGKPQYNNVYSYNAESYNPNVDVQYLRARYYCPTTADFLTEDSYLGNITDPLTLNRYSYVKSSPLNYVDPSGHDAIVLDRNMATDNFMEKLGIDHMGALIQNEDHEWYYFFWGETGVDYVKMGVESQKGQDYQGFPDLDVINKHFMDPNNPGRPNTYGTRYPFDSSVYIKGDFSKVHEKILRDIDSYYNQHGCDYHKGNEADAEERKACADCRSAIGSALYNLFTNNCSQVTMDYILQGILPAENYNGELMTVEDYFRDIRQFSVSPIPNVNLINLQYVFGNTVTNSIDFDENISRHSVSEIYE